MSDDELSEERKHKEHKKHKSSKRHKSGTRDRSRHDRDRRDHGSRDTAPQSTTGPCWQTMQFKLINGVTPLITPGGRRLTARASCKARLPTST